MEARKGIEPSTWTSRTQRSMLRLFAARCIRRSWLILSQPFHEPQLSIDQFRKSHSHLSRRWISFDPLHYRAVESACRHQIEKRVSLVRQKHDCSGRQCQRGVCLGEQCQCIGPILLKLVNSRQIAATEQFTMPSRHLAQVFTKDSRELNSQLDFSSRHFRLGVTSKGRSPPSIVLNQFQILWCIAGGVVRVAGKGDQPSLPFSDVLSGVHWMRLSLQELTQASLRSNSRLERLKQPMLSSPALQSQRNCRQDRQRPGRAGPIPAPWVPGGLGGRLAAAPRESRPDHRP